MRVVSTRVLPVPAPASTSTGPSSASTARALLGVEAGEIAGGAATAERGPSARAELDTGGAASSVSSVAGWADVRSGTEGAARGGTRWEGGASGRSKGISNSDASSAPPPCAGSQGAGSKGAFADCFRLFGIPCNYSTPDRAAIGRRWSPTARLRGGAAASLVEVAARANPGWPRQPASIGIVCREGRGCRRFCGDRLGKAPELGAWRLASPPPGQYIVFELSRSAPG